MANGEVRAAEIFEHLVGTDAHLPNINLNDDLYTIPWSLEHSVYKPVQRLTAETITERKVGGNGIFDALMAGFDAHLEREFNAGRIIGGEYTKAYIALTQSAMQNAVQFALGQDAAFWQAARAQADAITARTQNEIARINAMLARSQYALGVMKLATEDAAYNNAAFQLSTLMPKQGQLLDKQIESAHAQVSDTKQGTNEKIGGILGKQRDLYEQQVQSYKDDTKLKHTKLFLDAWVTRFTITDGGETEAVKLDDLSLGPIFEDAAKRARGIETP